MSGIALDDRSFERMRQAVRWVEGQVGETFAESGPNGPPLDHQWFRADASPPGTEDGSPGRPIRGKVVLVDPITKAETSLVVGVLHDPNNNRIERGKLYRCLFRGDINNNGIPHYWIATALPPEITVDNRAGLAVMFPSGGIVAGSYLTVSVTGKFGTPFGPSITSITIDQLGPTLSFLGLSISSTRFVFSCFDYGYQLIVGGSSYTYYSPTAVLSVPAWSGVIRPDTGIYPYVATYLNLKLVSQNIFSYVPNFSWNREAHAYMSYSFASGGFNMPLGLVPTIMAVTGQSGFSFNVG